jgi:ribosomal protein S18 acetylase RimI-like enzyme
MSCVIRAAEPTDCARLCDIQMEAWRGEYPHTVDPETWLDADGFDRAAREANMLRLIAAADTEAFLVAVNERRIVGFAIAGGSRDDDRIGQTELSALYFEPAEFGSGFARQLVEAAIGNRSAYLWVAELNGRAQHFYEKLGFGNDGRRRDVDTLFDQVEVRMQRP